MKWWRKGSVPHLSRRLGFSAVDGRKIFSIIALGLDFMAPKALKRLAGDKIKTKEGEFPSSFVSMPEGKKHQPQESMNPATGSIYSPRKDVDRSGGGRGGGGSDNGGGAQYKRVGREVLVNIFKKGQLDEDLANRLARGDWRLMEDIVEIAVGPSPYAVGVIRSLTALIHGWTMENIDDMHTFLFADDNEGGHWKHVEACERFLGMPLSEIAFFLDVASGQVSRIFWYTGATQDDDAGAGQGSRGAAIKRRKSSATSNNTGGASAAVDPSSEDQNQFRGWHKPGNFEPSRLRRITGLLGCGSVVKTLEFAVSWQATADLVDRGDRAIIDQIVKAPADSDRGRGGGGSGGGSSTQKEESSGDKGSGAAASYDAGPERRVSKPHNPVLKYKESDVGHGKVRIAGLARTVGLPPKFLQTLKWTGAVTQDRGHVSALTSALFDEVENLFAYTPQCLWEGDFTWLENGLLAQDKDLKDFNSEALKGRWSRYLRIARREEKQKKERRPADGLEPAGPGSTPRGVGFQGAETRLAERFHTNIFFQAPPEDLWKGKALHKAVQSLKALARAEVRGFKILVDTAAGSDQTDKDKQETIHLLWALQNLMWRHINESDQETVRAAMETGITCLALKLVRGRGRKENLKRAGFCVLAEACTARRLAQRNGVELTPGYRRDVAFWDRRGDRFSGDQRSGRGGRGRGIAIGGMGIGGGGSDEDEDGDGDGDGDGGQSGGNGDYDDGSGGDDGSIDAVDAVVNTHLTQVFLEPVSDLNVAQQFNRQFGGETVVNLAGAGDSRRRKQSILKRPEGRYADAIVGGICAIVGADVGELEG